MLRRTSISRSSVGQPLSARRLVSSGPRSRTGKVLAGVLALTLPVLVVGSAGPVFAATTPAPADPAATSTPSATAQPAATPSAAATPTGAPSPSATPSAASAHPSGATTTGPGTAPPPVATTRSATSNLAALAAAPANATIVVSTGSDRTGTSATAVSNLAGVTLGLWADNGGNPGVRVTDAWATCVSTAGGQCTFTVPDTGAGGANRDKRYWVEQVSAPSGYFTSPALRTGGSGATPSNNTSYIFRTGTQLRSGTTYTSGTAFMSGTASSGIWQDSRTNPALTQDCGIDVAVVLDLSGSVSSSLTQLKGAADTFADSLTGTPSRMALFSLAASSPAAGASANYPALQSVSTAAGATAFKNLYAGWTAGGGTNWDAGLRAVATAAPHYDAVVVITDGNPTLRASGGNANDNTVPDNEFGIFSANSVKAGGTRVIAMGVGSGVTDTNTAKNLRAISGATAYNGSNADVADFYQTTNYAAAGAALKQLALGRCTGSLSIVKQIVPQANTGEDVTGATPAGAGWVFDGSSTNSAVGGVPASRTTTANGTGSVNFPLVFPGGTISAPVTLKEHQQSDYVLVTQGGKNAVCTDIGTGASLPVTNDNSTPGQPGFSVAVGSTEAVSCKVFNRPQPQADLTVSKSWVINGHTYANGQQPAGYTAGTLTLTGPGTAGATSQAWGSTRGGYVQGTAATVDETAPTVPTGCTTTAKVTSVNGASSSSALPFVATLANAHNTAAVTNTVFCPWAGLTATKTATATYDAAYAWSILKQVATSAAGPWSNAAQANLPGTGTFHYRVQVTQGARTASHYRIRGEVRVSNPNSSPVTANLVDSVTGGTCTFDGGAVVSVPAGAVAKAYPYSCTFASTPAAMSGTNVATVSWSRGDYPQVPGDLTAGGSFSVSPSAGYTFVETTSTDKTVTVTDDHHTFAPSDPWSLTWSQQGKVDEKTYTGTVTAPAGQCASVLNTATLTGDSTILGTSSATARLCAGADLTVTKLVTGHFTRTYPWTIDKSTTTPRVDVVDGKATATYAVKVGTGDGTDSAWAMDGTITVHNPNSWQAVPVTSIADVYSGGGTCAVTGTTFPVSVPAGQDRTFTYTCTFASKPAYDGTNTATAHWDQAAAGTPSASNSGTATITAADWSQTKVNDTVTVHDDWAQGGNHLLGTLHWADVQGSPGHQVTLPAYTVDLPVPAAGTCASHTNTAWVLGTDVAVRLAQDSADVNVCNPAGLGITKTATGDFHRTYHWRITKVVDPESTVHIDGYSHTFGYHVRAVPNGFADSAWTVRGDITVTNGNTDSSIAPIHGTVTDVPHVGADASCVVNGGDPTVTLASGQSATLPYVCTVSSKPTDYATGTNTATVTWGSAGSASTAPVTVGWNAPSETDRTVHVYDDQAGAGQSPVADLGTATWNAQGEATVFPYTLGLTAPAGSAGSCVPFTNTAWIGGDGTEPTDVRADATATICPNPAAWTLRKTSTTTPDPLLPGGTITYTLTATHAGGVVPTDVTVTDDMSQVLDHAAYTGVVGSLPAGQSVDAPTAGSPTLTWHIAALSDSATLTYTVTVGSEAWDTTFTNAATPGHGGTCVTDTACSTTNTTPKEPTLHLVKAVDNGTTDGIATASDWTVKATGPDTLSGAGEVPATAVHPGSYALTEAPTDAPGPAGYTAGAWDCGTHAVTDGHVSLAPGDAVTCTITNTATEGSWTIEKASDPVDGATVMPGDTITYTLTARHGSGVVPTDVTVIDDLSRVLDDAAFGTVLTSLPGGQSVDAPSGGGTTLAWHLDALASTQTLRYTVVVGANAWSADLRNVVTPGSPGGTCATAGSCTTDHQTPDLPKLTLRKHVVNGLGGDASPADWTLSASPQQIAGQDPVSGNGDPATAGGVDGRPVLAGSYQLGESGGPAGYTAGSWSCDGAEVDGNGVVRLSLGSDVTCSITNTQASVWTLEKTSDPAAVAQPGQTVTYTLHAHHVAGLAPTDLAITDDWSQMADHVAAPVFGTLPAGQSVTTAASSFVWHIDSLQGDATLTYTVKVDNDAIGVDLPNLITAPGSNCPPAADLPVALLAADAACGVTLQTPAWTLAKSSDPVSGSTVDPGAEITYTLSVHNTSAAVLSGAQVTDDLSRVLNEATLAAVPAGTTYDAASKTLTWTVPDLAPDATATLSYTVTLDANASHVVVNVAAPVQPTGQCVTTDGCTTFHNPSVEPPVVVPPVVVPPVVTPPVVTPPVVTPPSQVSPPQAAAPASTSTMPNTGGPAGWLVPVGIALLLVGAWLIVAERRRRRRA